MLPKFHSACKEFKWPKTDPTLTNAPGNTSNWSHYAPPYEHIYESYEYYNQHTACFSNIEPIINSLRIEIFETYNDHNIVIFNHSSDNLEN